MIKYSEKERKMVRYIVKNISRNARGYVRISSNLVKVALF